MNRTKIWRFAGVLLLTVGGVTVVNSDEEDRERWDSRYAVEKYVLGKSPIAFLRDNVDLLPQGKALDIAMGEGRNGVFLATRGFQVLGLDISDKGLRKAHQLAKEFNTTIQTKAVDLEDATLPENEYDVVVMTYYLQRDLFPQIKKALKPNGVALIETYHEGHARHRPDFPKEYLLGAHELLEVFQDFQYPGLPIPGRRRIGLFEHPGTETFALGSNVEVFLVAFKHVLHRSVQGFTPLVG